jgi:hypothetical protein
MKPDTGAESGCSKGSTPREPGRLKERVHCIRGPKWGNTAAPQYQYSASTAAPQHDKTQPSAGTHVPRINGNTRRRINRENQKTKITTSTILTYRMSPPSLLTPKIPEMLADSIVGFRGQGFVFGFSEAIVALCDLENCAGRRISNHHEIEYLIGEGPRRLVFDQ